MGGSTVARLGLAGRGLARRSLAGPYPGWPALRLSGLGALTSWLGDLLLIFVLHWRWCRSTFGSCTKRAGRVRKLNFVAPNISAGARTTAAGNGITFTERKQLAHRGKMMGWTAPAPGIDVP